MAKRQKGITERRTRRPSVPALNDDDYCAVVAYGHDHGRVLNTLFAPPSVYVHSTYTLLIQSDCGQSPIESIHISFSLLCKAAGFFLLLVCLFVGNNSVLNISSQLSCFRD